MNPIKKFALAASYVTCLPLYRFKANEEIDLSGLAKYLPLVGLLLGLILSISSILLTLLGVNDILAAVLLTVLWLLLTNGLHLDGVMDTADGIFSHQNQERMLVIMQDSRVGNFGVLTGVCILLLKIAAMQAIFSTSLPVILLIAPIFGRVAECYAIGRYQYARAEGKGKIWHDTTKLPLDLMVALIVPLALCAYLVYIGFYYVITYAIASLITGLIAAAYLNKKVGGHTGDTYGAVVELTESISMILLILLSGLFTLLAGLGAHH